MNKTKATTSTKSALALVIFAMVLSVCAFAPAASANVPEPQMGAEDINDKFGEFVGGDIEGLCDDLKTDIDTSKARLDQYNAELVTATHWQTKALLRIKIASLGKNIHYLKGIYITECHPGAY